MLRIAFCVCWILLIAAAPISRMTNGHPSQPMFVGGIQVHESNLPYWVQSVKDAGLNTVEVTVYARQGIWNTDHMWFHDEEPWVIKEIELAKAAGLNVVLILRQALQSRFEENKFLWHGMIMPKTDKMLDIWFWRYHAYVEKWAHIADSLDVDVLAIGSELNAMASTKPVEKLPHLYEFYLDKSHMETHERRVLEYKDRISPKHLRDGDREYDDLDKFVLSRCDALHAWGKEVTRSIAGDPLRHLNERRENLLTHWREVICIAREIYDGSLTFAANFDNYQDIAFWDDLDFIGINAYFPLKKYYDGHAPSAGLYEDSWTEILREVNTFSKKEGLGRKPVLFTELGYINRSNCTVRPWQGHGYSIVYESGRHAFILWNEQDISHTERQFAMEGLYRASKKNIVPFAGLLYWKLTTNDNHLDIEPFALCIEPDCDDPAVETIVRFLH